ncbi:mucin-2-like [Microplitis mediator]|uniref:mucin-2-like n=1 Tax=Microplitis mediator TaxID=375433 RepID=UPI0025542C21|nr:mucin-2-like [Microplitis mediator]
MNLYNIIFWTQSYKFTTIYDNIVLEEENSQNWEIKNDLSLPRQLNAIKDVQVENQLSPQTIKLVLERIRIRKESKQKIQANQSGSTESPTDFVHSKQFKTYLQNLSVFSKIVNCNRVFEKIMEQISYDSQTSFESPSSETITDSSIVSTENSTLTTSTTTSPEETTLPMELTNNTTASNSTFARLEKNPATDSTKETTTLLNEELFTTTTENPHSIPINHDTEIITTTTSILLTMSSTLKSVERLVSTTKTPADISMTSDINNLTSDSPMATTESSNNTWMTTKSEDTTTVISLLTPKSPTNVPPILNRDSLGLDSQKVTMTPTDPSGTTHTDSPSPDTDVSTTEPSMDVNTIDNTNNASVNDFTTPTGLDTVVPILSNRTNTDSKHVISTTMTSTDPLGTTHTDSPSPVTEVAITEPSININTIDNTNNATVNHFTTPTGLDTVVPILSNKTHTDSESTFACNRCINNRAINKYEYDR